MLPELTCRKHNVELECLAGCSAHRDNWYCPECDNEAVLLFDFPPGTFALYIFPDEDAADKEFARLASNLELVKHSKRDLQTADIRLIAMVPGMKLRGLRWKNSRPNVLCVSADIDTKSDWFNRVVLPAMAHDHAIF